MNCLHSCYYIFFGKKNATRSIGNGLWKIIRIYVLLCFKNSKIFILWDKISRYMLNAFEWRYLEIDNNLVFCIPPCCTRKCKLNLYIYISSSPLICRQMGMRTDKYMRQKRRLFQRSKTMPICHSTNQTLSYTYTCCCVFSSLYT